MAKSRPISFLMDNMGLSEWRSCRLVGLARSVQQYCPATKTDKTVVERLKALASQDRRYGYLRLHVLLRREGAVIYRKRTYQLYRPEGLQVRKKNRRKLPKQDRVAIQVPYRPMQPWSLDFTAGQLADYRRFRTLNMVDGCSKVRLGKIVSLSINLARRTTAALRHQYNTQRLHSALSLCGPADFLTTTAHALPNMAVTAPVLSEKPENPSSL